MAGINNEQQTPENNVFQVNTGGRSFSLNQLSQFSPEQLQIVASFIQMVQGGTQPNNTLTPKAGGGQARRRMVAITSRNNEGTPLKRMQPSLRKDARWKGKLKTQK